jgi:hypothetical protein
VNLLILTNPPPVPHRLIHILPRTQAKVILLRPTKRKPLHIHLRINLPTKAGVQPNPTAAVINHTRPHTNPLTNNPLSLTAVLLTARHHRLRTDHIVNPPPHTNPTASLLPLTDLHLHPHPDLTVGHHLLIDPPGLRGAVLLLIGVRREVLPLALPGPALPGPVLPDPVLPGPVQALRRALLRKKVK